MKKWQNYNISANEITLNLIKADINNFIKNYKVPMNWKFYKILPRTIKTKFGNLKYKRPIYQINKSYICPTDEYFGINKNQHISNDFKLDILNNLGNKLSYEQITNKFINANLTIMDVCRINKNANNFKKELALNKVILQKGQKLNINVDDCYISCLELGERTKKMIRVISFNTGYDNEKSINKRKVLKDKRICYLIKNPLKQFDIKELAKYVKQQGNIFYENFNEANIILGGDGATWMKRLATELNAKYILDFFHAAKYFKELFIKGKKRFIKANHIKYNTCISLFKAGKHNELIEFLVQCNIRTNNKAFKYFKNNAIGIKNQSIENNIGVSAETDIRHLVKEICHGKVFTIEVLNHKLTKRAYNFNKYQKYNI